MAKTIVRMPDEMHRALKMEAVRQGIPMQDLVQGAVRGLLENAGKGTRTRSSASSQPASDRLAGASREEAALVEALLAFLRKAKDPARALGLRVIRAALVGYDRNRESAKP